jgi:hypothetical protein
MTQDSLHIGVTHQQAVNQELQDLSAKSDVYSVEHSVSVSRDQFGTTTVYSTLIVVCVYDY